MPKKIEKEYRLVFSDCSEFTQAKACGISKLYKSIDAAKNGAVHERSYYEDDQGDAPTRCWIVEVVSEGFPSGFTWN